MEKAPALMDKAPGSLGARLAWFVALWAAGVASVAAFAWLIRLWLA